MKKALSIAGSDSGGGAGIQADIKTFSALGVYATTAVTAITAQNTLGVSAVQLIEPDMVRQQLEAVLSDIGADAIKIGMLGSIVNIEVVSRIMEEYQPDNIVLDPVLYSKTMFPLLQQEAVKILSERLFPLVDFLTPNIPEAELLTGFAIKSIEDMKKAALQLRIMGPKIVLVKGGHFPGKAIDLYFDGKDYILLEEERINTKHTHGTGCTLSSAITAYLAKGFEPLSAVRNAKEYVTQAIAHSLNIGKGIGPTNHFYQVWKE